MKNPAFSYHRPSTVDEALTLLSELGDAAKVLAGGQSLLPIMALRLGPPDHLIDIGQLPGLDAITTHDDGSVSIGALVRHAAAERSSELQDRAPLVHEALPYIGHRAIRTRGTLVGSIAHADPAAEMPAVTLATDATMVAASSSGSRDIAAADFFEGYLQTSLRSDELLTEVRFPSWAEASHGAVAEVSRRHGDYALVGLACRVTMDGPAIADAALAFFGVDAKPVRVHEAEASLAGQQPSAELFAAAAEIVSSKLHPAPDVHGTTTYRRHLAAVLTRRGLTAALSNLGAVA